jgi:alpha-mannosidase
MWGTLAAAMKGYDFGPKTLSEAWTKVLLNQFHDILPGSSIQRVYQEAETAFQEVLGEACEQVYEAEKAFTQDAPSITVFNSLNWERKAIVPIGTGVTEVAVPACGWVSVNTPAPVKEGDPWAVAGLVGDGGAYLENELLRAEFNALGELTSLIDKATNRQQMAAVGNSLRLYKDVPDIWDAWDLNSMTEDVPVKLEEKAEIRVGSNGPFQASIRVSRCIGQSDLTQTISLNRGSRRIDFATGVNWQESHKLLKVNFPVTIHTNDAVHEIQFGHIRRPNHASRPYDADRFEVCNHKWSALVEEGRGVAVLNDCKYGLSVKGNSINLTLLKSALAPDMYADKGFQTFTYSIYYWNGSLVESDVVLEAYELNAPVTTVPGSAGTGSILRTDARNIIVDTVKPAEDGSGDVIVRLYESMRTATRCTLETSLPVRGVVETNFMEETTNVLSLTGQAIVLEFRPFEIKTLRISM